MFFDDEIEGIFKRMSTTLGESFGDYKSGTSTGPIYYGYTMTVGPDGRPIIKEYGNVEPRPYTTDSREPVVDVIVDSKAKLLKLVAEMPGVEKTDVKIVVQNKLVDISATRGEKKYHIKVPIRHRVDENSAKASYKNGILELSFKLAGDPKPKGKTVEVE